MISESREESEIDFSFLSLSLSTIDRPEREREREREGNHVRTYVRTQVAKIVRRGQNDAATALLEPYNTCGATFVGEYFDSHAIVGITIGIIGGSATFRVTEIKKKIQRVRRPRRSNSIETRERNERVRWKVRKDQRGKHHHRHRHRCRRTKVILRRNRS